MAIRMRSGGFQVDVQVDGHRYRQQVGTVDVARELEKAFRISHKTGRFPLVEGEVITFPTKKAYTFRLAFEDTLNRFWKDTANEQAVTYISNVMFKALGAHTALQDITDSVIDDFIVAQKASKFAPSTINKRLSFLSKVMRYAKKRGLITNLPEMEYLPVRSSRIRTFNDYERDTIVKFHAARGRQEWSDYFTVLLDTGMRCGEVRNIEMRDLGDRIIQIWKNKTDKPRSVPLTQRADEAIRRQGRNTDKPFAFANSDRISYFWNEIRAYLRLTNDKEFVAHSCRHDCASRLLKACQNIRAVQAWLGHENISQTQKYTHLHPADLQEIRDAMERV